jgi:hypothetical protein
MKKIGSGLEKNRIRDKHPGSATPALRRQKFCKIFLFQPFGEDDPDQNELSESEPGVSQNVSDPATITGWTRLGLHCAVLRIRAFLTLGSGMGKKIRIRNRDEQPESY